MAFKNGFVDETFDPSLKEFQNCVASSGSDVDFTFYVGFSKEVRVNGTIFENGMCPTDITWFNSKEHFTLTDVVEGTIEFNRDSTNDTSSRSQTAAGQTNQSKAFTIQGQHGSEFLEMFRQIQISDSVGGYNSELMKAYSNGGLHTKIEITYNSKNYTMTEYCLNVKTDSFPDMMVNFASDSELDFELLVEYSPLYSFTGEWQSGLGINDSGLNITDNSTVDDKGLTLDLEIQDTNKVLTGDYKVFASIINTATGVGEVAHAKLDGESTYVIPTATLGKAGDNVKVIYSYMVGTNEICTALSKNYTLAGGAVDPLAITLATDPVSVPLNDTTLSAPEDYISAFGAVATGGVAPVNITVDSSAVDLSSAADYDVIFTATDAASGVKTVTGTLTVESGMRMARSTKKASKK